MIVRWHTPETTEIDHERLWGWVLLAGGAMVAVALNLGHLTSGAFVCVWKTATGLPCPTCGMTRALVALARGEVWQALRLHPLVPVGTAALSIYVPYALTVSHVGFPRVRVSTSRGEGKALRGAVALGTMALWAFLVADGR